MATSQRKLEANRRNWEKRSPTSPDGLTRIREAALRDRPWRSSTGPTTVAGKAVARMNALKHGRETAQRRQYRRLALRFIRLDLHLRAVAAGLTSEPNIDDVVRELAELSARLRSIR